MQTQQPTRQELLDRIEELEHQLGLRPALIEDIRYSAGLTQKEAQMIAMLYTREECSKEGIHVVLYGMRPEERQPEFKNIETIMCKARAKLLQYGIYVDTVWGTGYRMTTRNKNLLRELLEQEAQPFDN